MRTGALSGNAKKVVGDGMRRLRFALAYWVVALGFFVPSVAYAYIDPATTTYIVQIITALVVMLGVSLSIFLYKFNMVSAKAKYGLYGLVYRLRNKRATEGGRPCDDADTGLGDDDARRYVPPDYVMLGTGRPPTTAEMDALGEPDGIDKVTKNANREKPWEKGFLGRLKSTMPLSLAISLSFILIGSMVAVIQNPGSIQFGLAKAMPVLVFATIVCFAALAVVLAVFRGRAYMFVVSVAAAILIAGYLQALFLNGGLGELTGDEIEWGMYSVSIVANSLFWLGVFVAVFLMMRFTKSAHRAFLVFVPFLIVFVQCVGLVSAMYERVDSGDSISAYWQESNERLTFKGIYEVAYERNTIVILLDRFDQSFVYTVLDDDPKFFEPLDGFTMFEDNISHSAKTFPSVTEKFTGHMFRWDQSDSDYFADAWAGRNFMHELVEQGVDVRLYTFFGFVYDDIEQVRGFASNIGEVDEVINDRIALVKLLKLSGFLHSPMLAKQVFWLSSDEFDHAIVFTGETMPYLVNDFAFYDSLVEQGLSVTDESRAIFSYIHLNGPHPPLVMDENVEHVGRSSYLQQTKG